MWAVSTCEYFHWMLWVLFDQGLKWYILTFSECVFKTVHIKYLSDFKSSQNVGSGLESGMRFWYKFR